MTTRIQVKPVTAISASEREQLLRLAYRFCWNKADAEDAVQDALLNATRSKSQLRDPSKRWPWLCRVVIQHCHLLGRKHKRRLPGADHHRPEATEDAEPGAKELGELIRRLLIQLPAQQRVALTLRHIEQMDYSQIARVMELTESTVRAHVRAGRETLRSLILARHPEWKP